MSCIAAWDIGFGDRSVITFHRDGRLLATYEARGQSLDELVKVARAVAADAQHVVFKPAAHLHSLSSGKTFLESLQERVVEAKAINRGGAIQ